MRETLQVIILHVINYSYFIAIIVFLVYVKMFIARRQYAWINNKYYSIHQRLNEEYLYKNNKKWFEQWLVGVTDGDGSFTIGRQNDKWSLIYKIAQSRYNLRLLYFIKKQLGYGSVTKDGTKGQILIRDKKIIKNVLFPIFDEYSLLTSKKFNYDKFKKAYYILENNTLTQDEKDKALYLLRKEELPKNYISPIWNNASLPLKTVNDINNVVTKPWLVGFIEAEGSFYLVSKDSLRIVHGFGITQKLDNIVLNSIKLILHIPTEVRYKIKHNYYTLDTTNSRAIENIIKYFADTMKGMKAVEYRIWCRSYTKYKGNYIKLIKIRDMLKIKNNLMRSWNKNFYKDNGIVRTI